ncbi:hypothetical protein [Bradyrhizobium manausense]|nr:hypothetical protein [Bradyrhizobium manausense]
MQKTIEWVDDLLCRNQAAFNPKRYDETRLRNTAELVFVRHILEFPIPRTYAPSGLPDVDAYKMECSQRADWLAQMPLVALPGIESYRSLKLGQLSEWCDFHVLLARAMGDDVAALRAFTPSAAHCSQYVDALEGKTDIKQVWRHLVASQCETNSKPKVCLAEYLSVEGRPDEAKRIKADVLSYGWQNCSTRYLETGNAISKVAASMEARLKLEFGQRFRVTRARSCAD